MPRNNHKAHEPNRFDLTSLPFCGAKTRSDGLCKHKGSLRNGRCKRHGGASIGPTIQSYGKDHHRYVHGLRTKEVIVMRKLAAQINKAMKDLVKQV